MPEFAAPRALAFTTVAGLHLVAVAALMLMPGVRERLVAPALTFVEFHPAARARMPEAPRMPRPVMREPMRVDIAMPVVALAPEVPVAAPADSRPTITGTIATPAAPSPPASPGLEPPRFDMAYLHNPAPSYPSMSRRLKERGRVILNVLVSAAGEAQDVEVRSSSGFERLDRAAIEAVRRWRFAPARRGSEAVAGWALVPILFQFDT